MIKEIEFKYCPKCKGPLKQEGHNLLVCQSCGLHYYVNPRITNAVIVQKPTSEVLFTVLGLFLTITTLERRE